MYTKYFVSYSERGRTSKEGIKSIILKIKLTAHYSTPMNELLIRLLRTLAYMKLAEKELG